MSTHKIALFEGKTIRKTIHNNQWWFSVSDIVQVLTESSDAKQYIKKMRNRDPELNSYWGTICTPLEMIAKDGKKRKINCANTEGIFRIIQSIPSSKAEPFKRWLAKVGHERVQEIEDPELAQQRMKAIYEKKGYSKSWIDKRLRGIAVRQDLTDSPRWMFAIPRGRWKDRGAQKGREYAILTNEIMQGAFGMKVDEYKKFKNLQRENLRDHIHPIRYSSFMIFQCTTHIFSNQKKIKISM